MTIVDVAGPKRSASFTEEERRQLLDELKQSGLHYTDFADQKGISRFTFRNWVKRDATPITERKKPRFRGPYSPTERKKTVEAFLQSGMTQFAFSQAWGVGSSTLNEWVQRYNEGGYAALEGYAPARSDDRRRGSRLPVAVRAEIIAVKKREPWFGLRKIRDWLLRFRGMKVSPNTIKKTIKEEGLPLAKPERKRKRSSDRIRRFERARRMQLWQSDITSFILKRHSTRVYLTVFMDDHSRYIVAWRLQTRQNADLVLDAFKDGIARYGKPEEVLTDQGRQYFAWRGKSEFEELLQKEGIKHVVSRAHHPETLGKCERFWKTVEAEFWERVNPADLDEARERLKLFIDHYNYQRPHQGLNGATPADRFFEVQSEVREAIEKTITENSLRLAIGELPKPPAFLIGQIGEQRIAFHGSSGQFILTHENLKEEADAKAGSDRGGIAIQGGGGDDVRPSRDAREETQRSTARDETATGGLAREDESELSFDPSTWTLGPSNRRGPRESGELGRHDTAILDGSHHGTSSERSVGSKPTPLLADDTTSSSWFNSRTAYAAQDEERGLDGEEKSRG